MGKTDIMESYRKPALRFRTGPVPEGQWEEVWKGTPGQLLAREKSESGLSLRKPTGKRCELNHRETGVNQQAHVSEAESHAHDQEGGVRHCRGLLPGSCSSADAVLKPKEERAG